MKAKIAGAAIALLSVFALMEASTPFEAMFSACWIGLGVSVLVED